MNIILFCGGARTPLRAPHGRRPIRRRAGRDDSGTISGKSALTNRFVRGCDTCRTAAIEMASAKCGSAESRSNGAIKRVWFISTSILIFGYFRKLHTMTREFIQRVAAADYALRVRTGCDGWIARKYIAPPRDETDTYRTRRERTRMERCHYFFYYDALSLSPFRSLSLSRLW